MRPPPRCARVKMPFYTITGCHWLSFLGDLRSNLAVIATVFCQNDTTARFGGDCVLLVFVLRFSHTRSAAPVSAARCHRRAGRALMFRKQIVLVWKQEGHGAVASFGQFFADCGAVVDDDDGAGLQQVRPKTAMR